MLSAKYMSSVKNLPAIMNKIIVGTAPERFTTEHLKGLGFSSSGDRAIIPLLKELGFLTQEGTPTSRYHLYRDTSKSKAVMAEAIREAYSDIFHINAKPSEADKAAIEGKFKSAHNVSDRVAELMTMTFYALLKLADLDTSYPSSASSAPKQNEKGGTSKTTNVPPTFENQGIPQLSTTPINLRYSIEIHLPPSKDIEVYNAIFRSLKENLLD